MQLTTSPKSSFSATLYGFPLSQVSSVASVSLCSSKASANLYINAPRSVAARSRHEGSLKAARAALTALSTSSAEAASTDVISFSSLGKLHQSQQSLPYTHWRAWSAGSKTYVGLMLVIFSPELDLTNSLLIKRPVGNVILRPLGAVSSTFKSVILKEFRRVLENSRAATNEA